MIPNCTYVGVTASVELQALYVHLPKLSEKDRWFFNNLWLRNNKAVEFQDLKGPDGPYSLRIPSLGSKNAGRGQALQNLVVTIAANGQVLLAAVHNPEAAQLLRELAGRQPVDEPSVILAFE